MKVLALATEAWGGSGGIAQSTRDLLQGLVAMPEIGSIDVLPRLAKEPGCKPPCCIRQYMPKSGRLAYALQAVALALRLKPDLVYCGHAFMAPLARLVAGISGARLITHVHGLEVWEPLSFVKRQALAASDLVLCVSHYTCKKVAELTGVPADRCVVVYNTIGDRFTPGDRILARKKFDLPNDAMVISTVSRLDPLQRHKGQDRVIPLLRALSADFPKLVYMIAGSGEDRNRLEALARSTCAEEFVRFLGFVADEDLPDLYRASDLYAMPSHGEGFGIAFIEAMACGTPAIGLNIGGAGDALRDGELGRAVAEADFPAALRAAMLAPVPEPADLAARTRAVFGPARLAARLAEAVAPLLTANARISEKLSS